MGYTLGYSNSTIAFMRARTLATHGAFARKLLRPGLSILDLGCGPGNLTLDLARASAEGRVLALDREESQIGEARAAAAAAGVRNVEFVVGEAGRAALPPADFDLVFSHALFEHLRDPVEVLRAILPALRPGGHVALRSPDWGGFIVHPETAECRKALTAYEALQRRNGGDTHAGRKLGSWLAEAGFEAVEASATYEVYPDVPLIAEMLAHQLAQDGAAADAAALRAWAQGGSALFAIAWFEAIGRRP